MQCINEQLVLNMKKLKQSIEETKTGQKEAYNKFKKQSLPDIAAIKYLLLQNLVLILMKEKSRNRING